MTLLPNDSFKMKLFLIICFIFVSLRPFAQQQDAKQLHETAKSFIRQGDLSNAELVLIRALQQNPSDLDISKDLAYTYYLGKDYNKALETIKPLLDRNDADDQCFQIAGNVYAGLKIFKDCEKVYKKGLKKFPSSGPLYNDYGGLLMANQDVTAIKYWEKGIETDPGYSGNYYNACKYYFLSGDKLWCALYSEIFINIEIQTPRTIEIKEQLLEIYKRIFSDPDFFNKEKRKNLFEQAFVEALSKQTQLASTGLTPESLTMIRTRFILDWDNSFANKFPFRLFEHHLQLLQSGLFDAYNQWLFGSVQNLMSYQNWTGIHSTEVTALTNFQKGRIFKLPAGQYYHQ